MNIINFCYELGRFKIGVYGIDFLAQVSLKWLQEVLQFLVFLLESELAYVMLTYAHVSITGFLDVFLLPPSNSLVAVGKINVNSCFLKQNFP